MKTKILFMTAVIAVTAALGAGMRSEAATDGEAKVKTIRLLTLEDANRISEAAQARAAQEEWNVVIVVVDAGGHLISLQRMDETQIGSIEIAIRKAETSVQFKRSTKEFEDFISVDNFIALTTLKNITAVEGGIPILHDGQVIGAIGVSGVTPEQDGIIAEVGIKAFQ